MKKKTKLALLIGCALLAVWLIACAIPVPIPLIKAPEPPVIVEQPEVV
tara:strand:+ start:294 stop:437 length:144 start_codon:yes stop_codon:yes gene_type:complete